MISNRKVSIRFITGMVLILAFPYSVCGESEKVRFSTSPPGARVLTAPSPEGPWTQLGGVEALTPVSLDVSTSGDRWFKTSRSGYASQPTRIRHSRSFFRMRKVGRVTAITSKQVEIVVTATDEGAHPLWFQSRGYEDWEPVRDEGGLPLATPCTCKLEAENIYELALGEPEIGFGRSINIRALAVELGILRAISLSPPESPPPPMFSIHIDSNPEWARIYASEDPEKGAWVEWKPEIGQNFTPSSASTELAQALWFKVTAEGYNDCEPFFVRGTDIGEDGAFSRVVELEPDVGGLKEMGRVEWNGTWVDPEETGLAQWEGRWVHPEVEGIVRIEGRWVDPEEEGLVQDRDGDWVTPGQRIRKRLEAGEEVPPDLYPVRIAMADYPSGEEAKELPGALTDTLLERLREHDDFFIAGDVSDSVSKFSVERNGPFSDAVVSSLVAVAGEKGANLLLLCETSLEKGDEFGNFVVGKATVRNRLYDVSSGDQLAGGKKSSAGPRKLDLEESFTGAIEKVAGGVVDSIETACQAYREHVITHRIVLMGDPNQDQLSSLAESIRGIPGVRGVSVDAFRGTSGTVTADLLAETNKQFLALLKDSAAWIEVEAASRFETTVRPRRQTLEHRIVVAESPGRERLSDLADFLRSIQGVRSVWVETTQTGAGSLTLELTEDANKGFLVLLKERYPRKIEVEKTEEFQTTLRLEKAGVTHKITVAGNPTRKELSDLARFIRTIQGVQNVWIEGIDETQGALRPNPIAGVIKGIKKSAGSIAIDFLERLIKGVTWEEGTLSVELSPATNKSFLESIEKGFPQKIQVEKTSEFETLLTIEKKIVNHSIAVAWTTDNQRMTVLTDLIRALPGVEDVWFHGIFKEIGLLSVELSPEANKNLLTHLRGSAGWLEVVKSERFHTIFTVPRR